MTARLCAAANRAGEPCRAAPLRGSAYCRAHDPQLPAATRFGSSEQAREAATGVERRAPKPIELLTAWAETQADELMRVYAEGLGAQRAVVVGSGPSARLEHVPDVALRLQAARDLLDRVYGKAHARQPADPTTHAALGLGTRLITDPDLSRAARELLRRAAGLNGSST